MNLKDIKIEKSQLLAALQNYSSEFITRESSDAKMVLAIGNTALLSIYFKGKGKVSFLAQGKDLQSAEAFAVKLIHSVWASEMTDPQNPAIQAFMDLYAKGLISIGSATGKFEPQGYLPSDKAFILVQRKGLIDTEKLNLGDSSHSASDKAPWDE